MLSSRAVAPMEMVVDLMLIGHLHRCVPVAYNVTLCTHVVPTNRREIKALFLVFATFLLMLPIQIPVLARD